MATSISLRARSFQAWAARFSSSAKGFANDFQDFGGRWRTSLEGEMVPGAESKIHNNYLKTAG
jgi:hypothetical protein